MRPRTPTKGILYLYDEKGVCYEAELKDISSIELSRDSEDISTADGRITFSGSASVSITLTCREMPMKVFLEPEPEPKEIEENPAQWEEMILNGVRNAN